MRTFVFFTILLSIAFQLKAQEQQVVVPYTLADRDRAIRTEATIDVRFDSQQKQIDQMNSMLFWGFGVSTSLILFILGYMIWDRRTAMKPALEQASSADDKSRRLADALREYSKKHPDLAELLRAYGLL